MTHNILVIEDDEIVAGFIENTLQGYGITLAYDGLTAEGIQSHDQ